MGLFIQVQLLTKLSLFTLTLFFLSACSTRTTYIALPYQETSNQIEEKLNAHFRTWEGVPYIYGGNSIKGIDCSGFIQITYKQLFNLNLPRTSSKQYYVGKTIEKSQLQAGDLIFFKTSRRGYHVGIYLNNNIFIHASSSKGVTKSKLSNPYWRSHYVKSKRVLL